MRGAHTQTDRVTWGDRSSGARGAGEHGLGSRAAALGSARAPLLPAQSTGPTTLRVPPASARIPPGPLQGHPGASPHGQGHARLRSEAGKKEHKATANCVPVSVYFFFFFFF